MFRPIAFAALLLVAACSHTRSLPADNLDAVARDYVKLSLTIGEKEEGYIDAYYGPPEWREEVRMAAAAMTLSQFLSGITSIIACFLLYFLGQSASYWERLAGGSGAASEAAKPVLSDSLRRVVDATYFLLPRLDRFDVRERLVNDLPIGLNYIAKAGASGAIYTAVLLTIAYFAFSDREF